MSGLCIVLLLTPCPQVEREAEELADRLTHSQVRGGGSVCPADGCQPSHSRLPTSVHYAPQLQLATAQQSLLDLQHQLQHQQHQQHRSWPTSPASHQSEAGGGSVQQQQQQRQCNSLQTWLAGAADSAVCLDATSDFEAQLAYLSNCSPKGCGLQCAASLCTPAALRHTLKAAQAPMPAGKSLTSPLSALQTQVGLDLVVNAMHECRTCFWLLMRTQCLLPQCMRRGMGNSMWTCTLQCTARQQQKTRLPVRWRMHHPRRQACTPSCCVTV